MKSKKKSEMLEVRLSHDDKLALQAKARCEGRSVSVVVRQLISDYLTQPESRSPPYLLMERLMTLKSKPKFLLTAAAVGLLAPLGLAGLASAEDVAIRINGEYTQPVTENGVEGKRVRRFDFDVHMEADGSAILDIPSQSGTLQISVLSEDVDDGLALRFVILDNGVAWNMSHELGSYTSPSLIAAYDVPVQIEIGYEGGEMFKMKAIPSKLPAE